MLPTTNGILATYIPRLNYKQAATVGAIEFSAQLTFT